MILGLPVGLPLLAPGALPPRAAGASARKPVTLLCAGAAGVFAASDSVVGEGDAASGSEVAVSAAGDANGVAVASGGSCAGRETLLCAV